MDAALVDDFEGFMEARLTDVLENKDADLKVSCREAYLLGFRDAMKIMAGA